MTEHLHQSTQQMIRDIERKDQRFRFAQSVFMVLLIAGFIAGGWFAAQAYQSEQKARDKANTAVVEAVNSKLDEQSKQLKCIVEFFTIEDREDVSIRSVEDCFTTDRSALEGEQRPNFTPDPSGPALVINPLEPMPGLEPGTPQASPEPEPDPVEPTERPPVRILGIPVCVPLLDVCVRQ